MGLMSETSIFRRREVLLLAGVLVLAGRMRLSAEPPVERVAQQREEGIALQGQSNFRDLGGYRTSDGRTVRTGLVFRSGELPHLTDEDVAALKRLGIKTVVNFLTAVEVEAKGRDRLPEGVKEISLPIKVGDDLAKTAQEAQKSGDFTRLPPEINPQVHEILVDEATAEYAAVLREIAKPESRPIVFHCSHGVHRTGTAAAIVLSALGVPWETVQRDYLLTNEYRKEEVEKRLEQLRVQSAEIQGVSPDEVDMTNINAFYILQPSYIDASLDEVAKQYGSMENYIRRGLGVEDKLIEQLRSELLEN